MASPYNDQDTSDRLDWRDLCDVLLPSYIMEYRDVDVRDLGPYLDNRTLAGQVELGDQTVSLSRLVELTKLACPTLRTCSYFQWDMKNEAHGGIDIMLPKGTPIPSFTDGVVIRIKHRDGETQDEGNCVVIQDPNDYVVSYKHLNQTNVTSGDQITQGTTIGTCGSTGSSTQYHLHLQVDEPEAPFHPYRSDNADEVIRRTRDPLPHLRAASPKQPFDDLPQQSPYNEAILKLARADIIKGHDNHVYPNNNLQRYEMALLMDRILLQYAFYDELPTIFQNYTPYRDVTGDDPELTIALERLQKHGVMKGHNQTFYPHDELKGEELLALLGRVFFGLKDSSSRPWRQPYQQKFLDEHLIAEDRDYLEQPIPRKEVFLLIYWLLVRTGHLT